MGKYGENIPDLILFKQKLERMQRTKIFYVCVLPEIEKNIYI
jgi:hypothetical protein